MSQYVLQTEKLSKSFGKTEILHDICFRYGDISWFMLLWVY